jgi:ABC-2 type transport system permease protein
VVNRLLAIIRKEVRHIFRDPRTLAIVIAMPIMMVLLYGYALNMDIEHIKIAIADHDRTPESARLIERFESSAYFDIVRRIENTDDIEGLFMSRGIKAALVIPQSFAEERVTGRPVGVQLIVDGSDPTVGNAVINYASAITVQYSSADSPRAAKSPVEIRDRFLYNPDLVGSHFIIPGLVAVILMMVCALLTSITVAREKETGTMDVLLVSPVRPFEIILGKVVPYIALALLDAVFILAFAKAVFDIPLRGDLAMLLWLSILYIYCALGIGLFISSMAPTQQVAMMAALVATILPSVMLSGFIFPIFSMPLPIRVISHIVPARYYMEIIRGILLKSSDFSLLLRQTGALALLGTLFLAAAAIRFQKGTSA